VSLRKLPSRTPAVLATNQLNARKSTGPRGLCFQPSAIGFQWTDSTQGARRVCSHQDRWVCWNETGISFVFCEIRFAVPVLVPICAASWESVVCSSSPVDGMGYGTKPECPLFSERSGPRLLS
jgi:hypothetical protein